MSSQLMHAFAITEDGGYNGDFTDEDAALLCRLAPFANLPQHRYYPCGWTTGEAVCRSLIRGPEFPEHLRSYHGIIGPDKASLMCCWVGCFSEMKKESLIRHVNERHLEFKYHCPHCPEQFTRTYTMQNHITKKHLGG